MLYNVYSLCNNTSNAMSCKIVLLLFHNICALFTHWPPVLDSCVPNLP
jgi:hypothetical protein